jgi:hypothetical protein
LAAGDLTTVERVRSYLKLGDLDDDDFIALQVSISSAWMKSECARDFLAADYTHTFDADGSYGIRLRQFPVVSVTSVKLNGEVIPERATETDAGWVLNGDRVELVGGFRFSPYNYSWGYGFRNYGPGFQSQNVEIVYRAGYETLPADLEQAVILHASLSYYDRDRFGKQSVNLNGETVSFNGGIIWSVINGIVDKYRAVRL